MHDDATLFRALQQLHIYGMLIVRNVPDDENSVSNIGERIGPIKTTFYGYTWDVRSVPEAKNVAYTSQDLGFHMDLLYMHQPPHLQLLHCLRSSAAGGASLFADSYKAAADLFTEDIDAFITLATSPASFHYNHPESGHLYHQDHIAISTQSLTFGFPTFKAFARVSQKLLENEHRLKNGFDKHAVKNLRSFMAREQKVEHYIQHVAWSPPFQAPIRIPRWRGDNPELAPLPLLNDKVTQWHRAAQKFSKLIHRQNGIYERTMLPGECVIFDNRRVLHARKAFEVGDAGKERWLRGTYLDWDPYWSKMRVLGKRFGKIHASE
jgi:alpha-ketoglutarate-dependent taurine dioxygenase